MDLFEINSVNLGRGEMAAPGTDLMLQQLLQTDWLYAPNTEDDRWKDGGISFSHCTEKK